jgi:hypothetical protein
MTAWLWVLLFDGLYRDPDPFFENIRVDVFNTGGVLPGFEL